MPSLRYGGGGAFFSIACTRGAVLAMPGSPVLAIRARGGAEPWARRRVTCCVSKNRVAVP